MRATEGMKISDFTECEKLKSENMGPSDCKDCGTRNDVLKISFLALLLIFCLILIAIFSHTVVGKEEKGNEDEEGIAEGMLKDPHFMELLNEVFLKLPRGSPGSDDITKRAFDSIPSDASDLKILDLGSGLGPSVKALLKFFRDRIKVIVATDILDINFARYSPDEKIETRVFDMSQDPSPLVEEFGLFDIIWAEGSVYNMGFINALQHYYHVMPEEGYFACSDLHFIVEDEDSIPKEIYEYFKLQWAPDMQTVETRKKQIEDTGKYEVIDVFVFPKESWFDEFYGPAQELMDALPEMEANNPYFGMIRTEVEMLDKYSDFYSYAFFILKKL